MADIVLSICWAALILFGAFVGIMIICAIAVIVKITVDFWRDCEDGK